MGNWIWNSGPTYLLFPLLDGEFVLAEYLCREELLVGEVAGRVLVHAVVVAVLGLHLVRGHQHRLLRRAVDVLGQDVAPHLGIKLQNVSRCLKFCSLLNLRKFCLKHNLEFFGIDMLT